MSGHIKGLRIHSFRGIRELRLEELAPVNILTGDNNCGKTSILEVLRSLQQPESFGIWKVLEKEEASGRFGEVPYEGILHLFCADDSRLRIAYEVEEAQDGKIQKIEICAKRGSEKITEEYYWDIQRKPDKGSAASIVAEMPAGYCTSGVRETEKLSISVFVNGYKTDEETIYDIQPDRMSDENKQLKMQRTVIFVSPFHHAEGKLFLNSVLDNPILYEQMIAILREFDPGILSINVDNSNEKYRRGNVYKILSREHNCALPLNIYGDGMKKAVLLMSAVIKAQGGILLLDEFETAIHTSAMEKTFRWILETCEKLDVQLFMTSHSMEAIDKVLKCSPRLQEKIKVYTLYKNKDRTAVRSLGAKKAIEMKDEMGLELR